MAEQPEQKPAEQESGKFTAEQWERMCREVAEIVRLNKEQCPQKEPKTEEEERLRRMA
jgi:hypothetical protein